MPRGKHCGQPVRYSDKLIGYACVCRQCGKHFIEWYGLQFIEKTVAPPREITQEDRDDHTSGDHD